jgi:hypothetical protein
MLGKLRSIIFRLKHGDRARQRVNLPLDLRKQYDEIQTPAERSAFRKKHWRELTKQ